MPTYRLQDRHGNERTLRASRVVSDGVRIRFEDQRGGQWRPVLSIPVNEVHRLVRRVNETYGWRWVPARVEPAAEHQLPG